MWNDVRKVSQVLSARTKLVIMVAVVVVVVVLVLVVSFNCKFQYRCP
jgi:flagellar biosynthesis/type III secretory pathway M-ring protein FliF/YscJ